MALVTAYRVQLVNWWPPPWIPTGRQRYSLRFGGCRWRPRRSRTPWSLRQPIWIRFLRRQRWYTRICTPHSRSERGNGCWQEHSNLAQTLARAHLMSRWAHNSLYYNFICSIFFLQLNCFSVSMARYRAVLSNKMRTPILYLANR